MKKIKIKLIDEWKQGWKFISVNCMWLSMAIQGAWLYMPDDLRTKLPDLYVTTISILLLLIGIIGRFIDQYFKQSTNKETNASTFENIDKQTDTK